MSTTRAGARELQRQQRLREWAQEAAELGKGAKAPNTRRAYLNDWAQFRIWCHAHGLEALPAAPTTIGLYIAARSNGGAFEGTAALTPASFERALAAIAWKADPSIANMPPSPRSSAD